MLRKLYRHEFYSLFRNLIPVYIGLIGITLLSRMSFLLDPPDGVFASIVNTFKISSVVIYFFAVFAMFIIGLIIVVTRFYKNLLSHEGYLTFTLPFKASQHLNCKFICAYVVTLVNFVVLLLSVFVYAVGTKAFGEVLDILREAFVIFTGIYTGGQLALVVAEVVLLMAVSFAAGFLMLYAAMAIGQQFKSRIGASVVAYICLNSIQQFMSLFLMLPLTFIGINFELNEFSGYTSMVSFYGIMIVYELVLAAVYYFVTRYLLTKRLNLE